MLEFILDKNEFIDCRRDFISREFLFWVLFELIGAVFVFIMTMVFIKANKNLSETFYLVTLSVWIIFSIICNRNNKKLIQKDIQNKLNLLEERNMFGPCIIEVSSDGINVIYNNGITGRRYPWKIVREVFSFKKNIYIYISSFDYLSIPKNAFKNEEERNGFLNKINSDRNDIKERLLSIIGLV
ncbi:YcxB family protein [Clostridium sp.]|uniref:YcxB family protein n=1 Tax=Clostridium sp. TaxID=1506 RepID=UPI0026263C4D|nr:YcxB family protein [Clostridium sp.]